MNIEEVRQKRDALSAEIARLIRQFQTETGVSIREVNVVMFDTTRVGDPFKWYDLSHIEINISL